MHGLVHCKKWLKSEKQKTRRLNKNCLWSVVDALHEKEIISTNCAEMIESSFGTVLKEIFQRILEYTKGKNPGAYPDELEAFATTLQFYSTKALSYLGKIVTWLYHILTKSDLGIQKQAWTQDLPKLLFLL